MKLIQQFNSIPFDKNTVLTVGTFDGVHLAHRKIIEQVVSHSRKRNGRSLVVTFDPHPREIIGVQNSEIKLLTTIQERQDICEQLGIDWFIVVKFDHQFSQLSFRDFYVNYLVRIVGVSLVIEGYDHHWGKDRKGNIDILLQLGSEFGFDVIKVEPFMYNGILVNSSIIREELIRGSVERATSLLGRLYSLSGNVIAGDRRGRLLGYPTANLQLHSTQKLIPKDGIYLVKVLLKNNSYYGIANIGVRPTFHIQGRHTVEVHILDFDQDIYDSEINIHFLRRLRDELKYDSADQLIQQMNRDKELSQKLLMEYQNIL